MVASPSKPSCPVVSARMFFPFVLVTSLFALWGFANDITNPLVAAFKNILLISNFESSLVQAAFYGGYCVMAVPAAIFIKRFSYKGGILVGLALYAIGCLLFIPSGWMMAYWVFLLSYFIMTCGLSFLETSSNPYILSLGEEATATRRLNFAQAFNPLGSITGMLIAKNFILAKLDPATEEARRALVATDPSAFAKLANHDLDIIILPYAILGIVVFLTLVIFLVARLPKTKTDGNATRLDIAGTFSRLFRNPRYRASVLAQTFYEGAQITAWTFIIQYAEQTLGMRKQDAQFYNIIAMVLFVSGRFICTYLLKFFNPGALIGILAGGGFLQVLWTIFGGGNPHAGEFLVQQLNGASGLAGLGVYLKAPFLIPGMSGLVTLVGVSLCMSLMFPTIYGIALRGLGEDAKLGAAGLIFAIVGACVIPPVQGWIMDLPPFRFGAFELSSIRASFVLPLICFIVLIVYGYRTWTRYLRTDSLK